MDNEQTRETRGTWSPMESPRSREAWNSSVNNIYMILHFLPNDILLLLKLALAVTPILQGTGSSQPRLLVHSGTFFPPCSPRPPSEVPQLPSAHASSNHRIGKHVRITKRALICSNTPAAKCLSVQTKAPQSDSKEAGNSTGAACSASWGAGSAIAATTPSRNSWTSVRLYGALNSSHILELTRPNTPIHSTLRGVRSCQFYRLPTKYRFSLITYELLPITFNLSRLS